MLSLYILQTTTPGGGMLGSLWPLILMFIVVFFFLSVPRLKKQKEQVKFLEALDKGEEVVTTSGIIGRINKIDGSIVTLAVNDKTFMRITKGSISKDMTEAYRKAGLSESTPTS